LSALALALASASRRGNLLDEVGEPDLELIKQLEQGDADSLHNALTPPKSCIMPSTAVISRNSRFGRFISRLAAKKFRVVRRRELSHNTLIRQTALRANGSCTTKIDEIPGYFPRSREFAIPGRGRLHRMNVSPS
jgi:hypothetical protein